MNKTETSISYLFSQLLGWSTFWVHGDILKDKLVLILSSYFKVISLFIRNQKIDKLTRPISDVVISNKHGIYYCRKGFDDAVIVSEPYEKLLNERFFSNIKSGVFLDIGANVGKYTIMVARQLKDKGKVIAFEPDPKTYKILLQNIKLNNLKNVLAFNCACWSEDTYVHFNNSSDLPTTGSYSVKNSSESMIEVKAVKIDTMLKRLKLKPDFIKIDVEGAEVEVLQGALLSLSANPGILIEVRSSYFNEVQRIINSPYERIYKHNYMF